MGNFSSRMKYSNLLKELVSRDVKTKYRRSVLGLIWTVLNPLLMMLVMTIVFSQLFRFDIPNFPVYLLSGQLIFNYFSEATSSAMGAIIHNASLIKKVYVPKLLFPMSRILSSVINLFASYCALILVMLITRTPLHVPVLFSLVPVLFVVLFASGVGLFLAAVVVKFRDVMHLYSVLLIAWMYLTPVFYPVSILPPAIRRIIEFNPMTVFIVMFRMLIMENSWPSAFMISKAILACLVAIAAGYWSFRKLEDRFILFI